MQSTVVVLFAILVSETISKPIAPEVDESVELCQYSDSENCTISFRRHDATRSSTILDTSEETIENSEFVLPEEVRLSSENPSLENTRKSDVGKFELYILESIDSKTLAESAEENIQVTKIFANKDLKNTVFLQNQGFIYNEEHDISPNENSRHTEIDDNIPINGDVLENDDRTEQNYLQDLPEPQNVEIMDAKFTLEVNANNVDEASPTHINKLVEDSPCKQIRQSKSAFPDYEEDIPEDDGDTNIENSLDILHNLEMINNQEFDDLEDDIDILKETDSLLSKETDDMRYSKFSISEEAHFAKDSNITTIIGCVGGCEESPDAARASPEKQIIEIRHEEIDLEIKILESDLGETTTPAIWNTGEFVDRTSRNYPLIKRDVEDLAGNIDDSLINFTSIANSSDIEENEPTNVFENTTDIEIISNFLEKLVNSTLLEFTTNKLIENQTISLKNLSEGSWIAYYNGNNELEDPYYNEKTVIKVETETPYNKNIESTEEVNPWYFFSIGDDLMAPGYV